MNSDIQQTIAEFLTEYPITLEAQRTQENPYMAKDEKHPMYHWLITLHYKEKTFPLHYSIGSGHAIPEFPNPTFRPHKFKDLNPKEIIAAYPCRKPTITDVLDCVASDAYALNYDSFEEWANEFGYDTDSRKAERTYHACIENGKQLREMLGRKLFTELLECERL